MNLDKLRVSTYKGELSFFYDQERGEEYRFVKSKVLGSGSMGDVVLFKNKRGAGLAVKSFKRKDAEIQIVQKLEAEGVISACPLIEAKSFSYGKGEYVVMNAMNDTLHNVSSTIRDFNIIAEIMKKLITGASCLDAKGWVYFDYKLDNVLFRCLDQNRIEVLYGDLGSIYRLGDTNYILSYPPYEYRDLLNRKSARKIKATDKVATFGLGIILMELMINMKGVSQTDSGDIITLLKDISNNESDLTPESLIHRIKKLRSLEKIAIAVEMDHSRLINVKEMLIRMLYPDPEYRLGIDLLTQVMITAPSLVPNLEFNNDRGYYTSDGSINLTHTIPPTPSPQIQPPMDLDDMSDISDLSEDSPEMTIEDISNFEIEKLIPKKNCVLSFGTHKPSGQKLAIKFWFRYSETEKGEEWQKQQLLILHHHYYMYETAVYETLKPYTNRLGLVKYYGRGNFSAQDLKVPDIDGSKKAELLDYLKGILCYKCVPREIYFLATEWKPSDTIDMYYPQLNVHQEKAYILHVLCTLKFLGNTLQLQHNDLHLGNVLIRRATEVKGYYYIDLPGIPKFATPRGYGYPLLFDWDLSYTPIIGKHLGEDMCHDFGLCEVYNERFDVYTILREIQDVTENMETLDFISRSIPRLDEKYPHRMCNRDVYGNCVPFPPGEPSLVKTILEMLQDPYFNQYRL
jgi:serine/threonine protein kinase